jgi:hypothetical protein
MSNVTTIEQRALVPTSSRIHPIIPQNMEEAWRIATALVRGKAVPKNVTQDEALISILAGLELGLAPIAAVQRIAVINGRPLIWGDGALGLVRASKLCLWIKEEVQGEGDARVAVCTTQRKDDPDPVSRTFSVEEAKKAGLWQTEAKVQRRSREGGTYPADNDSPWFKYPNRMLQMRARAYCLRDVYPDVLGGLYLREEFEEELLHSQRPTPPPPPEDEPALIVTRGFYTSGRGDYVEGPPVETRPEPPEPPEPPDDDEEEAHEASDNGPDPVGDAMQRGYDDRKAFPDLARDSVPPEWRNDRALIEAWQEGFDRAGHAEPDTDEDLPPTLARFEQRAAKAQHEDELADLWGSIIRPVFRSLSKEEKHRANESYHRYQEALRDG